jgi:hypothetical protein
MIDAAVFSRILRRLLEQLALAQFGEHVGLADLNAHAATLCFRFALAAILWVKPDQKGFRCGGYCHIMGYSTYRSSDMW